MSGTHAFWFILGPVSFFATATASWSAASLNDLGLQQVVEVGQKHFRGSAGYRFEVLGRTNPFYIDGPVGKATKAPVMTNTVYAIGEAGNYPLGMGVMKHTAGVVYGRTSYLRELLEVFNHDTRTLFLDNTYLLPGNWSLGLGVRGMQLINADDGVTDYEGWSPSVSAGRLFRIGGRQHLRVRWSHRWTRSSIQGIPGTNLTEDRLDHWSTGLSLDHGWQISESWSLRSHGRVNHSRYANGANQDRNDTLLDLGSGLQWEFLKYFSTTAFVDYSNRLSSQDRSAFTNWDGGLRLHGSIRF